MKRSAINVRLRAAQAFLASRSFPLPPFAFWTPADWATKGAECREIVERGLGWDVTDFGLGDFAHTGLTLFTLRNGPPVPAPGDKTYAEKVLIGDEGQLTPLHFHHRKMEDIINRGRGDLLMHLWNADPDERLADTPVVVQMDGTTRRFAAGATVRLAPGESITLPPRLYHDFQGAPGAGTLLIAEVSSPNDDATDNRFLDPLGRFSPIDEDEPPLHLLCTDYPPAKQRS
jgi:D-lyxose ketol-isomerase